MMYGQVLTGNKRACRWVLYLVVPLKRIFSMACHYFSLSQQNRSTSCAGSLLIANSIQETSIIYLSTWPPTNGKFDKKLTKLPGIVHSYHRVLDSEKCGRKDSSHAQ